MLTTIGALGGLAFALVLIARRVAPVYALLAGAFLGGLLATGGPVATLAAMFDGAKLMIPCTLRILASGVLIGALMGTGSAAKISDAIVTGLGIRLALPAVAIASMILCAIGVFADVAVVTVAPVALSIARRSNLSVPALLLAMIGGSKAGNIISPNPNTIVLADAFGLDLTSLMAANIVPALCALAATVALAAHVSRRLTSEGGPAAEPAESAAALPSLAQAVAGPCVVILLLAMRPVFGVAVDPFVALPAGGIASVLACGRWRETRALAELGLSKMSGVALLLIGMGTLAGIIRVSGIDAELLSALKFLHLPTLALAPLSGILMAGATASTAAGSALAGQAFAEPLVASGIPALAAAAMVHAGATVASSLPHGSFFHVTAGAVNLSIRDRLKLIPYECAVGLVSTSVSVATAVLFY